MIRYTSLKKNASVFKDFTGLTVAAFQQLLPAFAHAYAADLDQRDQQRTQPRQRQRGGGRSSALDSLETKLVFILFYFKYYPVQGVQGYLFGLGQPQANGWIQRLTPLLHQALGYQQQLPARKPADISLILAACPGLEFIIDGTERPIRRPKHKRKQRSHYSGKKKRHTVKNNLIIDKRTGKIKGLSPTCEGQKHDKKLAEEQAVSFPVGSKLWKDSGFQGYEPEGVQTFQPKKKPRGSELTAEEKAHNREVSRERIGVEHSLGGVKVYHIVHAVFRNLREGFEDVVMAIACGLHNLRLDHPLTA
jgi:DDE superfamily endonuclease/Helix-turn-helix of DDE superfamily endonuclease